MGKHSKKHNKQQGGNGSNNINTDQMGNFLNMDPSQLAGLLNNIDLNQISSMFQGMNGGGSGTSGSSESTGTPQGGYDKRLELLNAMKPLVDAEKAQLIDSIIQIYNISRIIKK